MYSYDLAIGSGVDFKGVYDLRTKQMLGYKDAKDPFSPHLIDATDLDAPHVVALHW